MPSANLFVTARDTQDRIAKKPDLQFSKTADSGLPGISVDASVRKQTIEGFGGAFTESAATTIYKLPPEKQAEVFRAYFDKKTGNGYTLCRTHINSCDFALGNYAYVETPGDVELKSFSIERDRQALIPMIKEASRVAGEPIKLLASPWSPPAWMKTTGKMNFGGQLKPEYRAAWAAYYPRYIQEYTKEGFHIWGITVQNEPQAVQTWDSCIYSGEEERDFVRDYLGPAMERAGLLGKVKLFIWDHNRDIMVERAKAVLDDPAAARYVDGTAFHWYVSDSFDNVQKVHDAYPDKALLFTEGCQEGGPHTGEWELGERYARSLINDLNRWTYGWIDWNLALDEMGGPNHAKNYCSAPILIDTKKKEILYQSSYYYLGHFSRFIKPGAQGIDCKVGAKNLIATAFLNTDKKIAVVVMNQESSVVPFSLDYAGQHLRVDCPARSIVTAIFDE